jgi:transposase
VRVVLDTIEQAGQRSGVASRTAGQLGIGTGSLRSWVRQAEVDGGRRPGLSTAERQRLVELERQNRELRRANDVRKAAASSFARGLDPRPPRS